MVVFESMVIDDTFLCDFGFRPVHPEHEAPPTMQHTIRVHSHYPRHRSEPYGHAGAIRLDPYRRRKWWSASKVRRDEFCMAVHHATYSTRNGGSRFIGHR